MELLEWLEGTTVGQFLLTMLVSMVPVVELRGGLPFGVALGLSKELAFVASVLGNIIPAPFIVVFIERIFTLIRRWFPWLNGMIDKLERRGRAKGEKVRKYQQVGLWLLVAIPLPGTGAWTGALVAALMDLRLKKAMPAIVLGVLTAGCIMLALTHVGINLFA